MSRNLTGPAGPVDDGARLQPVDGPTDFDDSVSGERKLREWLADPVLDREAQNLARLLGDADMLLQLQLSGYSDRIWSPIAEEFARYGVAVIKSWIVKRTIFGRVKARTGFQLRSCPGDWLQSVHVADDLASLTVVLALQYFKENVLKANRWDPSRGASLRTFFIGQCLYQFSNVYKNWLRDEQELHALERVVTGDDLHYLAGGIGDIEERVVTHDAAVTALGTVTTANARRAFAMKAIGYSHDEIAVELDLPDDKSVENLLGYQVRLQQQNKSQRKARNPPRERRTS